MAAVPGNYSYQSSEYTPSAATSTGGRISNGLVFNSAGGSIGLVKMLALAGVVLLVLKVWRAK